MPDASHLTAAAARIGFPCVVKPAMAERRLFGEKALILRNPAALQARLPAWPEDGGELLVQRYVEGLRHNLHLVAKDGKLLRCLDTVSLRTQRLNGSGLTVSSDLGAHAAGDARVVRKAARRRSTIPGSAASSSLTTSAGAMWRSLSSTRAWRQVGHRALLRAGPAQSCARAGPGPAGRAGACSRRLSHGRALRLDGGGPRRPGHHACASARSASAKPWHGSVARFATRYPADIHAAWDWGDLGPTWAIYRRRIGLGQSGFAAPSNRGTVRSPST